ncbi:MAG: hypothetical protein ACTSRG_23325 [Candidatus Helarchaeota archaeon]
MRLKYYVFSFILGIVYIIGYLIILNIYNWSYRANIVIDIVFLIINFIVLVILIIKDLIDEIRLQSGKSPIGSTKIEHAPFIFILAIMLIYSIFVFPPSSNIKLILAISCIIDCIWDFYQDKRSHSLR